LAEFVAVGEEALFGAGFFFVAAGAAQGGVYFEFGQGVEQGDGLQAVAAGVGAGLFDGAPLVDAVLHVADDEAGAEFFHQGIAVGEGFGEVMAGVYVQEGKGILAG
jgi:hypothetical protein